MNVGVVDDVPSIIFPAELIIIDPLDKPVLELVPPLAIGNTPLTSAVKLINPEIKFFDASVWTG